MYKRQVLTGMVELSQNGEPLFEPFIPDGSQDAETPLTDRSSLIEEFEEEKMLS